MKLVSMIFSICVLMGGVRWMCCLFELIILIIFGLSGFGCEDVGVLVNLIGMNVGVVSCGVFIVIFLCSSICC